jgi:hypothetical protein
MSIEGLLPTFMTFRGNESVTIHDLGSKGEFPGLAGVLASRHKDDSFRILNTTLLSWGDIPVARPAVTTFPDSIDSSSKWLDPFFSIGKATISPESVYAAYSRATARKLLTGHLLAVLYSDFLREPVSTSRPDLRGVSNKEFKLNSSRKEPSITSITARHYRLLTEWLESSPLQALASFEGVRVVTIRNRLQSARDQGLIENPGPGKRSAKKN